MNLYKVQMGKPEDSYPKGSTFYLVANSFNAAAHYAEQGARQKDQLYKSVVQIDFVFKNIYFSENFTEMKPHTIYSLNKGELYIVANDLDFLEKNHSYKNIPIISINTVCDPYYLILEEGNEAI